MDSALHRLVLAVAIAEPLMTIPQIYQIWSTHTAAGVSLVTWFCYISASVVWIAYSVRTKDVPLAVSSVLWFLTELLVIIGTLRY